ncbi:MAG: hypothetical protein Kow002_11760 [Anaerolineales bacterium]
MDTKHALILILLTLALSACGQTALPPTHLPTRQPATATPTSTQPPTQTPTAPFTETPLPTETRTITPAPIPTYAVLRAEVISRANCRYGPGWPYLYKYGLLKGNNIEVIGRIEHANWVYVQAIGGNNPCWVRADLLNIQGELSSLEPVYPEKAPLPVSPYYPKTIVLEATRDRNQIFLRWLEVPISPGDFENDQMPWYIIEVWRCEAGEFLFEALATSYPEISFIDEPGCGQASHGRIFVQEKHGFAGPAEIPWPSYE